MSCFVPYFEFYPGEHKTLRITLNIWDKIKDCKNPLDLTGATGVSIEIPANPTNILVDLTTTPVVSVVEAKLGQIKVDLIDTQTDIMQSGSFKVIVIIAGKKYIFYASGAAKRVSYSNC